MNCKRALAFARASAMASALAATVACGAPGTHPDDMSARDHQRAAARHDAIAERHERSGGDAADIDDPAAFGPSAQANYAAAHRKHAEEHRTAAGALASFEDAACAGIPPEERAECPLLGSIVSANDKEARIVLRLSSHAHPSEVTKKAECHIAFARSMGRSGMPHCPLYVEGVMLLPPEDIGTIELTTNEPIALDELRQRVHDHAGW